ncbi:hypothetical protein GP486_005522 [Trichoglossum hirsutum]|uniref:Uncharacterized protein n=1 Tax=Trichoglossum hirsutum TaxID=265104 RepID=A0A9P8RM42_9PEZI|nr:hypothetical protein GP486_005522 [Trichoglossum hirsutum]
MVEGWSSHQDDEDHAPSSSNIAVQERCIVPDSRPDSEDTLFDNDDLVPKNVQFVIDDADEEDWLYAPDTFDYIHTRMLLGCFGNFADIIKRSFKYIKPVYCDDSTIAPDWPFAEWTRIGDEAAMRAGKPMRIANKLKRWFLEAGFVDVHEEVFKIPMNPWPKDPHYKHIGRISEVNWLDGLQAFTLAFFHRVLGWNQEEIEAYLVPVRRAIRDRSVHAYHKTCDSHI